MKALCKNLALSIWVGGGGGTRPLDLNLALTCNILFAAVCDPPCANGGTCISPSECLCTVEWEGDDCTQGKTLQSIVALLIHACLSHQLSALKAVPMVGPVYSLTTACVQSSGRGTTVHNVRPMQFPQILSHHNTSTLYTAVCGPPCVNGECTAPDTCVCTEGWNGSRCNQGEVQRFLQQPCMFHITQHCVWTVSV